jgi:hypothetical protein
MNPIRPHRAPSEDATREPQHERGAISLCATPWRGLLLTTVLLAAAMGWSVPTPASADSPWTDPNYDTTPAGPADGDLFISREGFYPTGTYGPFGLPGNHANVQSILLGTGGGSEVLSGRTAVAFSVEFDNVGPGFEILGVDTNPSAADNTLWGWAQGGCLGSLASTPAFLVPGSAPAGQALGTGDGLTALTSTVVEGHFYADLTCVPGSNDSIRILVTHGTAVVAGTSFTVTLTPGMAFADADTIEGLVVGAAQGAGFDPVLGTGDHGEGTSFVVPLVPTSMADVDDDGFTTIQGDCDDADAALFPASTEICNGFDDDCDGAIDEPGATSWQCRPDTVLLEQFDSTSEGNLILLVETFVPSVDLTGVELFQDSEAGVSTPGGPLTDVHSILVRNWQGGTTEVVSEGELHMTFPPEVTLLGWVIDFSASSTLNRDLDGTFATSGQSLRVPGKSMNFEPTGLDWITISGQETIIHTAVNSGGDEARLLVSYDPAVVGELLVDIDMSGGVLQDLTICDEDQTGLTNFTFSLTTNDRDLLDSDLDGWAICNGDCHDLDETVFPGAEEFCDEIDSDCDGDLADGFADGDGDGIPDCVDDDPTDDDDDQVDDDDDDDDDSSDPGDDDATGPDDDDDDQADGEAGNGRGADCSCVQSGVPAHPTLWLWTALLAAAARRRRA